jgi:hypothetical protein
VRVAEKRINVQDARALGPGPADRADRPTQEIACGILYLAADQSSFLPAAELVIMSLYRDFPATDTLSKKAAMIDILLTRRAIS